MGGNGWLHGELDVLGAGFAAVDGGFVAPFGGKATDALVDGFVEAEEVADYAAVEEGAVGVGALIGPQKPFAIEMYQVAGGISTPHLSFPRNISQVSSHRAAIRESSNIN